MKNNKVRNIFAKDFTDWANSNPFSYKERGNHNRGWYWWSYKKACKVFQKNRLK